MMKTKVFKNINVVWVSLLMVVVLLTFINNTSVYNTDSIGLFLFSLHAIATLLLLRMIPIKGSGIIAGAFVARFFVMLWDIYASDIFLLPNSGGDTEFYFEWAEIISGDLSYLTDTIRGGLYSKILGIIFYITGPLRILGQYINVLLGVSTVIIIYKIMLELKINNRTRQTILALAAFFPNSLIMSAILLREILPTFFIALSLLYFIRWYKNQTIISFFYSLIMVGFASTFHSGVAVIAIGYLFMILFYSHISKGFVLSVKNVLSFIPVIAFAFIFITQFGDVMFKKFNNLEEDGIYGSVRSAAGGSGYLEEITINNPIQLLVYGPVRAFYFMFSPLPMNWRGMQDIITFLIDSLFYIYVFYFFYKHKKWFRYNNKLIIALLITLGVVVFVFGIGVSNSGTAMRHRQKLIPIILIFLALMKHEKYKRMSIIQRVKSVEPR